MPGRYREVLDNIEARVQRAYRGREPGALVPRLTPSADLEALVSPAARRAPARLRPRRRAGGTWRAAVKEAVARTPSAGRSRSCCRSGAPTRWACCGLASASPKAEVRW